MGCLPERLALLLLHKWGGFGCKHTVQAGAYVFFMAIAVGQSIDFPARTAKVIGFHCQCFLRLLQKCLQPLIG